MDQATFEHFRKLEAVFMPHAYKRRQAMIDGKQRFVHYTNADAAMSIISNKEFWLRDTRCMNDFTEVRHGYEKLHAYFNNGTNRDEFFKIIDVSHPGAGKEAIALFDKWWPHIPDNTYISCLSEHDDSEDHLGRLSMWRGYGHGTAGIAIIFRIPLERQLEALKVFLSPVAYLSAIDAEVETVKTNVAANLDLLKATPREFIIGTIYAMLLMSSVSLKHVGFAEEREWRLIHTPMQFPSKTAYPNIVSLGGLPQTVYKLPFKNSPEIDIQGIELPEVIDRIIIGPSLSTYQFSVIAQSSGNGRHFVSNLLM
jgi:hypothetical protein